MTTAHIFVSGFVQGVGYRAFVKKHAIELGLTGWVKNLPDGRVEAVLQGDKKVIEQMIEFCQKGSFLAEVKNVTVSVEPPSETFSSFEIRRD